MTESDRAGANGDGDGNGNDEVPSDADPEDDERLAHLDGLADGCGCAEVWEHLSEQRSAED